MDKRLAELHGRLQQTDDPNDAAAAISELEAEAKVEWLPQLHAWLAQPGEFFIRESAAPAVIRLEGMAALPRLIAALRMGFAEEHDCDSLQTDVFDLIASAPQDAARILLPMADSASAEDREEAAWLLGFVGSAVSADVLLRLASDAEPTVRSAGCSNLTLLKGHEPAFAMLTERRSDPDSAVRVSAANALGYFGDPRALPLLERPLQESTGHTRRLIEFAIKTLRKK